MRYHYMHPHKRLSNQTPGATLSACKSTFRTGRRGLSTQRRIVCKRGNSGASGPKLWSCHAQPTARAENRPDHAQSLVNLRHVRELLPNWVPKLSATQGIDSFFSWHKVLSAQERLIVVALVALAAAVLGAFGFYFAIPALKWSALIFAVVWLVLMASVGHSKFSDIDHGVVMVDSIARASDSVNAPSRYTQPLPPGTEVKVLARQDDWVKVQLNDGRDAWLRATQIHTI